MFRCILQGWEVPFPAIWEAVLQKFHLYATRQPMVALRLDSVTYNKNNDPTPLPRFDPPPPQVFR